MKLVIAYCIVFVLYISSTNGQGGTYKMNLDNGLESNHVYKLITDRYGYLWIATEKGVYRYNGYELKKYDASNGLYNDDIWDLHQDQKGRIWLISITDELAYIENNKLINTSNSSGKTLYPRFIADHDSSIFFLSRFITADNLSFCRETKNTIRFSRLQGYPGFVVLKNDHTLIRVFQDSVFSISFRIGVDDNIITKERFLFHQKGLYADLHESPFQLFVGSTLLFHKPSDIKLGIINTTKYSYTQTWLPFNTYYLFQSNKALYAIGDSSICELDSMFCPIQVYTIASLTGGEPVIGNKCSFLIDDTFWQKCLATNTNGLYLNIDNTQHFSTMGTINLKDYRMIGQIDTVSYWWNNKTKALSIVNDERRFAQMHKTNLDDLLQIIPYNNDSSLVFSLNKIYWFNRASKALTSFYTGFDQIETKVKRDTIIAAGGFSGQVTGHSNFYLLSKADGLNSFFMDGRKLYVNRLANDRYSGVAYDSVHKYLWLYKRNYIAIYRNDHRIISVNERDLTRVGIKHIEQILLDKNGNVFIKQNDKLTLFNTYNGTYRNLFSDHVLTNASICLQGQLLVLAGKFGVLFSKVTGQGRVSGPVVCPNVKGLYYTSVTGLHVSRTKVLLSTDKDSYWISIPGEAGMLFRPEKLPLFKVTMAYNDKLQNVRTGDTLPVNQYQKIQLDVIRPQGVGKPYFKCGIDELGILWENTASGEISLPVLNPDRYYKLSLIVGDDVWNSPVMNIQLYVIPHWWQRKAMQKWLWLSLVLTVGLIVVSIVYITRRIVIKSNRKRNMLLELELKAIHAQINPHFIYNTLTAIVYFVSKGKLDEAISHIHKFSKLLRAYIASSRNKVIRIKDEVHNLTNYIELQRARFHDKFDYTIQVDEAIDQETTIIPSLLLQPIVENAINHGLFHKKGKGNLKLVFKKAGPQHVRVLIEDNGIGRIAANALNEKNSSGRMSYGNDLIKDLIKVFNKYEQMHIMINYQDIGQSGTIVTVDINHKV